MIRQLAVTAFALLSALTTAECVDASIHNAAADYSPSNNPAGVWSYGYSSSSTLVGSSFNLYTSQLTGTGGATGTTGWGPAAAGVPIVSHNDTAATITDPGTAVQWAPGQLAAHPDSSGLYSIVRWTAPATGFFDVFASFDGLDADGTTTDVHVLHNGVLLFNGAVNGYHLGAAPTYSLSQLPVLANDTIDFAVGFGTNGSYLNDTTAVDARVSSSPVDGVGSAAPEPVSVCVWLILGCIAGGFRSRRW